MANRRKSKSKRAPALPRAAFANVIETGQHIWLAGLGAVARAQQEGPKLFEALVMEGSEFQQQQRENVQERTADLVKQLRSQLDARTAGVRGKATDTMDNLEDMLQTRILTALHQLGVPSSHEIEALSRKVKELNRSVQALTQTKSGTSAGRAGRAAGGRRGASSTSSATQQGAAV